MKNLVDYYATNFAKRYTPENQYNMTMAMEKKQLEDVSPIKNGDFPASHVRLLEDFLVSNF